MADEQPWYKRPEWWVAIVAFTLMLVAAGFLTYRLLRTAPAASMPSASAPPASVPVQPSASAPPALHPRTVVQTLGVPCTFHSCANGR